MTEETGDPPDDGTNPPDDADDSEATGAESSGKPADPPSISPRDLQDCIERGDPVRVLDLRNRDEVERWQLSGESVTLTQRPTNRFIQAEVTDSVDVFVADVAGDGEITVVCARGEASAEVAETLDERGYEARNLAGGMDAWARLYLATELDVDWGTDDRAGSADATPDTPTRQTGPNRPSVVQYRRPSSGCLSYVVCSDGAAVVVDPLRAFTDRYLADARDRDVTIEAVVDTHVHADHVSGLRSLAAAADARAVMPAAAVDRGVTFDVDTVADGDEIRVGDAVLTAVHAPGHTSGMTAFAVGAADADEAAVAGQAHAPSAAAEATVLLTGDSLFVDGVARPDLERGADGTRDLARALYRTLTERFARFADDARVAPGHHGDGVSPADDGSYTARLGDLRALPVPASSAGAFVDHVTGDAPPRPANAERIVAINLGRETADDDAAFELELGPNNCAATPATDD